VGGGGVGGGGGGGGGALKEGVYRGGGVRMVFYLYVRAARKVTEKAGFVLAGLSATSMPTTVYPRCLLATGKRQPA